MTAFYLLGGLAVGLGLALPISAIPTPGHPHVARNVLSGLVLLAVLTIASRAWGRALAAQVGDTDVARHGRVAALSFASALIAVAVVLGLLEPVFVEAGAGQGLPIHVVFGLLFVPSAFFVAGITAWALARIRQPGRAAVALALRVGGAAALAFLATTVGMDAIGWRVGAPGAAQRATMLVVTLVGCLAAALAGGALLGRGLQAVSRAQPREDPPRAAP